MIKSQRRLSPGEQQSSRWPGVLSVLHSEQPPSFHTVAKVAREKRDTDTRIVSGTDRVV